MLRAMYLLAVLALATLARAEAQSDMSYNELRAHWHRMRIAADNARHARLPAPNPPYALVQFPDYRSSYPQNGYTNTRPNGYSGYVEKSLFDMVQRRRAEERSYDSGRYDPRPSIPSYRSRSSSASTGAMDGYGYQPQAGRQGDIERGLQVFEFDYDPVQRRVIQRRRVR